jgi:hypothetical protein
MDHGPWGMGPWDHGPWASSALGSSCVFKRLSLLGNRQASARGVRKPKTKLPGQKVFTPTKNVCVCVCVGVCIARHFFSLFCSDSSCFCVFLGEGGGRGGGGGVEKNTKKILKKKSV